MRRQGYNDKLDETMGARNGKKSQSMKDRRDESKGMEKSMGRRAYKAVGTMDMSKGGSVDGFKMMPGDSQFKRKSW